uniref:Putative beta-lactamase n=1 Tax=uncultured prokaryote EC6 TaxID=672204 RepID=D3W8K8_9ZZZZ|nr:putative beta-lactamase [uncultured prokaryote EC6]
MLFGSSAVFPDLELVHYSEQFGQVPQTQILFGQGTVKIRIVNHGKLPTDPMTVSVSDFNVLMRQVGPPASVAKLKPDGSVEVTFKMDMVIPPPKSQLGQQQQFDDWKAQYASSHGVDLRGQMKWSGPPASTPMNDRREVRFYTGYGDSTACQEGSHTIGNSPPEKADCDADVCVTVDAVRRSIHQRLDCRVVGYAAFISGPGKAGEFATYGKARTSANGPVVDFTANTKITVASVSKAVTALAAIKSLAKKNVSLDAPIGPHLPKDWMVDPHVAAITFAELLAQKSGIRDYGNTTLDYAKLKTFFTQKVNPNAPTNCNLPSVIDPKDAIVSDPVDRTKYCYSNYNFAIFRILLPMVEGFQDTDPAQRAERLAAKYVKIVQANVFEPVGLKNVDCKPPMGSKSHALAYAFPGNAAGHDWGDNTLQCGADGWYLSVDDISRVLISLNRKDEKVLTDTQFKEMISRGLGWDLTGVGRYQYVEKNGKWSWGSTSVSTSILIFGPTSPGPAFLGVLFTNSDVVPEGIGAATVLQDAFLSAARSMP